MKRAKKGRIKRHGKKIIFFLFLFILLLVIFPFFYPWLFYNPPGKDEIVIIGLEGASQRVIEALIEEGKLPNFKHLIENGSYQIVNSSILSSKVWGRMDKSFLEVAFEKNKTVVSLYWPSLKNTEVRGLKKLLLINPLSEFLKKLSCFRVLIPVNKADKDLVYDFYLLDLKMREFFLAREELKPDVSLILFSELPRLQLYFWMYMEPWRFKGVDEDEIKKYGEVIEDYYEEFDSYLGKLVEENVTVIIISGYGFDATIPEKIVDKILVNKILEAGGLLSFDYRGEVDFSKTKAYSLEEGLEEKILVHVNAEDEEELEKIKNEAFNLFSQVYVDSRPAFDVFRLNEGILLERKIPLRIPYESILIKNERHAIQGFILRRVISGRAVREGILIVYGDKAEIECKSVDDIPSLIVRMLR